MFFRAAYLLGFKPWDSGVPPPELVSVVEGDQRLTAGRYLDLGCGTGTNCIYAAQHGWDATGVDFVPRAIGMAKRKAAAAASSVRLMVGDVTRLAELRLDPGFDLVFDLGCLHSIADEQRDAYVRGATQVAKDDATMLLFCALRRGESTSCVGPRGVERGEVAQRFARGWEVVAEEPGQQMLGMDSAWYRLRRRVAT